MACVISGEWFAAYVSVCGQEATMAKRESLLAVYFILNIERKLGYRDVS